MLFQDTEDTMAGEKRTKLTSLWILGICIHILTFFFVLDLYFTSPMKHGMTPHKSEGAAFAKRVVIFIADGLRAEAIYPKENWDRVEYLSELRLNGSCSWGIVHTGVPTESRPGHVAIFAGLMEDPSAIFTGWQANTVEFDSVINESNYAWSYGSPDIVKIFTKQDKAKLNVDYYNPDQEDFSGRSSTINLDNWVFEHVEELLTPKGNSCEAQIIRKRTQRRRMQQLHATLIKERAKCQAELDICEETYNECYKKTKPCFDDVTQRQYEAAMQEADFDLHTIEMYPCVDNFDQIEDEQLCKAGNVFFLHLLGMDTAGHVHKPDSKEYLDNLRAVDAGIRESENLFEAYFHDNATAYLFTADHGMTNWGSHGDGSEHETEVPYILWGAGVMANKLRHDLQQTDLAPLLASLIGVPVPINSVGVLPHKLLNGTNAQISEAVLANVMQHVEQYKLLLREFAHDPLFTEYPHFKDNYVDGIVHRMRSLLREGDPDRNVVRMGEEFMKDILAANQYMRNYYFKPKIITVMFGFVLWIVYLALSIHVRAETRILATEQRIHCWRFVSRLFTLLLMIVTVYYLKGIGVKYFTYVYPMFLLGLFTMFAEDHDVVNQFWIMINMRHKTTFLARTAIYAVLVQLLVFGFFNRLFCACVVLILAFWLTQNGLPLRRKVTWLLVTGSLGILQIFEPSTKFKYYGLGIGSLLWITIYFAFIDDEGKSYIKRFDLKYKTMTRNILLTPLLAYLIASCNALYVAHAFDTEAGLSDVNLVISWVITAAILMMIPAAPKGVLIRFGHICGCLIVPYVLMAVNIDLIFYSVLVVTLYYWMEIESQLQSNISITDNHEQTLRQLHFRVKYRSTANIKVSALYRYTYFYLALTVCYFFAIGNMASFNGFDPQWTRTYVATFNPFLMAALILIKMIIPFFLITCAFYAIVLHTRASDTTVFTILLLFLDQMVLNFMLFVRNQGSWLEIGKSLSHFAVMEAMALVMLVFFALARYVCSFRIGDAGTGFEPEEDSHDSDSGDTNVEALIEEGKRKASKRSNWTLQKQLKKSWWCVREIISSRPESTRNTCHVKPSKSCCSLKSFKIPASLLSKFVTGTEGSEGDTLESITSVPTDKVVRSQEVQCKFEDETVGNTSSSMYSASSKQSTYKSLSEETPVLKKFEKIFSGSKKDIFKVAFDLGIAATLDHCYDRSVGDDKSTSRSKRRKHHKLSEKQNVPKYDSVTTQTELNLVDSSTDQLQQVKAMFRKSSGKDEHNPLKKLEDRKIKTAKTIDLLEKYDTNEDWEPKELCRDHQPVYDLCYYDIFPTMDKLQAKQLRTIHHKPFTFEEGYLNISTYFSKNPEGQNTGMISHPSYDDLDCNFYSTVYSDSHSSQSPREPTFHASYFSRSSRRGYKQGLRKIKSVPHLETVTKLVKVAKVASENDLQSRLWFEEEKHISNIKRKEVGAKENPDDNNVEKSLEKQLENFNLSRAVYSTIKPGMNVSSKISIIRTESYFDPTELQPAGSRIFRGSRTSFNSPDVLKLAPGLSHEESQYYFMSNAQKADLVQKLLASTRAKTPHEQGLINSYFKQVTRQSDQGDMFSGCSGASSTSISDTSDPFEILHKEAMRNQKRRRREHAQRVRELLTRAKEREEERLTQEKLLRLRAEEALKAEEDRLTKELASRRRSSITLVPSQAVFDLGHKSQSEIRVLYDDTTEKPLKLVLPELPIIIEKPAKATTDQDVKVAGLEAYQDMAQIIATEAMKMVPERDVSQLQKAGNFPFRQLRQDRKQPSTKSPLIQVPVKRKVKIEPDTSSESEGELGKSKDKRQKRRKLKERRRVRDTDTESKIPIQTRAPSQDDQRSSKPKTTTELTDTAHTNKNSETTSAKSASSAHSSVKNDFPTRGSNCRDRYDKSCCIRKRPSAKFISNAQEMAVRLGKMLGESEQAKSTSMSKRIARLPIRVAPGILATGRARPQSPKLAKKGSKPNAGLLQRPSEEIIKEERELEPSSSISLDAKIKPRAEMPNRSRHKRFLRSSPTLFKINSNSTLITDPKASENRLSISNEINGQNLTATSSSESEDYSRRQENELIITKWQDNKSWKQLEGISDQYAQVKDNLSSESMPDSMLTPKANDSDPSSMFSDLPEDAPALPLDAHPSINFEGVTTSLKIKEKQCEAPNTCYGVFTVAKKLNAEVEVEPEWDTSWSCDEELRTPRFQEDPSKYLVKVESWLKNINLQHSGSSSSHVPRGIPDFDLDVTLSESTVTTADLLDMDIDNVQDEVVPVVEDQTLVQIAKSLIEEQCSLTLEQALQTVSFVLQRAGDIARLQQPQVPQEHEKERNVSTEAETQTTEVSISNSSIAVGTNTDDAVTNSSTQTTHRNRTGTKVRSKSKLIQCIPEVADHQCMTECSVDKVMSNIGIQHSFTEVSVNTDIVDLENVSTQISTTLVDVQVGTVTPRINTRDIGVSPSPIHIPGVRRECYRNLDPQGISTDVQAMGEMAAITAVEFAGHSPIGSASPEGDQAGIRTSKKLPVVSGSSGTFEAIVQNLRVAFSSKVKKAEFQSSSRISPVLPDELCSRKEKQKRRHRCHVDVDDVYTCTSRYESPPKSPIVEAPPKCVPALKLTPTTSPPRHNPKPSSVNTSSSSRSSPNQRFEAPGPSNVQSQVKRAQRPQSKKGRKKRPLKRITPRRQIQSPQIPRTLENLMSNYARVEASKPYRSPLDAIVTMKGLPNPRPKVRSVPRTDYAELPEEHQETEEPPAMPASPKKSPITARQSSPQAAGTGTNTNSRPKAKSSQDVALDSSNMATTWRHFTAVIKRWRRQGMSEEEICKEIERQKLSRRASQ